jgi:hypothetical protein
MIQVAAGVRTKCRKASVAGERRSAGSAAMYQVVPVGVPGLSRIRTSPRPIRGATKCATAGATPAPTAAAAQATVLTSASWPAGITVRSG